MTILCFEELPDSSSLQWVAVRADPAFKTTPGGKETLVVCFKNGNVYEYLGMKDGDAVTTKEMFETMRELKVLQKIGARKSPGTYFNAIKNSLRLYKSHGNHHGNFSFSSFAEFHLATYGKPWKNELHKAVFPVRNWVGRLVGW